MHFLNTAYVNWFKTKYHIVGPILQGRFKGKLIDKEDYFCNASAYIHLNPVRAGLVKAAEDYPWSSYACLIGKQPSPPWLSHELIIGDFSGDIDEYKCFMRESYLTEKDLVYEYLFEEHGLLIGSDAFKEKIKSSLKKQIPEKSKQELPDLKILCRLSLNEVKVIVMNVIGISEEAIFSNRRNNLYKKVAIHTFHKHTDATLTDIGKLFSIKYSAVSLMVKKFAHIASADARVAALLAAIDQAIAERRCQVFD
jgi:hypothetical protein